ncbi:MAG: ABC transporter ATP-binding protein [Peptococcaceae bacterium]|jgi:iron complex transport system ATP-binding protein|nr:ABC transporter ATP-binding protein [Peptococcaceae bacterium]
MSGELAKAAGQEAGPGIDVRRLSFSYDIRRPTGSDSEILREVSFQAPPGRLLAVLGSNGAGKTTLFRCMLGLLRGYTGEVLLDGALINELPATELARKIAYVPQSHYPAFNYSVFDMVLMGTTSRVGYFSAPGPQQEAVAEKALERLGIGHLRRRGYMQISGGERQLVLIARALAQQARFIVMDEPTANLDYGNQLLVLSQIKRLAREGYSVIQSTHNPDHAFMFADIAMALRHGRVRAFGPPAQALTADLIGELYHIKVRVRQDEWGTRSCAPALESLDGAAAGADR